MFSNYRRGNIIKTEQNTKTKYFSTLFEGIIVCFIRLNWLQIFIKLSAPNSEVEIVSGAKINLWNTQKTVSQFCFSTSRSNLIAGNWSTTIFWASYFDCAHVTHSLAPRPLARETFHSTQRESNWRCRLEGQDQRLHIFIWYTQRAKQWELVIEADIPMQYI